MTVKIFKYKKVVDAYTTHCLAEPDYEREGVDRITELCTIEGLTYVAVPDSIILPPQQEQIKVEVVELTEDLIAAIKDVSPHIALINQRVVERIRKRYSWNDELKTLRRAVKDPDIFKGYNDYAEQCVAWGKAEKAKLGL